MPRVASLLAQRFLHRVGQWGKGPWHALSWALSSLPVPCTVPHPALCSLSWLLPPVLPRIERAAVKQRPPVQFRKPPCVWLARLCPGRMGRARVCLAHFHPGSVRGHCGRSRSRSRVGRDETKLGAAPSALGTAKAALLFLVGEFPCLSWGVGGEKGGAG